MSGDDFSSPFDVYHVLPPAASYRPTGEFRELLRWWNGGTGGVCCLAGIGGSGKTATLDEFLRRIRVLAPRVSDGPSTHDSVPAAALVFSLAQGTSEALWDELRSWVPTAARGPDEVTSGGRQRLLSTLASAARRADGPVLIAIDGLEAVQSTGTDEGVGRVLEPNIREVLVRAAAGALPNVAVVVTSRLALTDIEIQRLPAYRRLDLDVVDDRVAIELLRSGGITGTDREVRRLAERYGYHALTLASAAGYAERTGRAPAPVPTAEPPDTDVLETYLDLARTDPTDAALLDLLSLFRRGASIAILHAAAALCDVGSLPDLDRRLKDLTALRLLNRTVDRTYERVSLHEVYRQRVHAALPDDRRRAWHSRVGTHMLESLQAEWGSVDVDGRFARLQECIEQLAQGEDPLGAFLIYWERIGNYRTVSSASRYAWGEAVCRLLNQGRPPGDVAPYLREERRGAAPMLMADWGLYLSALGELGSALQAHQASYHALLATAPNTNLPVAAANLADLQSQRGVFVQALDWAARARQHVMAQQVRQEGMPTKELMDGIDDNYDREARAALATDGVPRAERVVAELREVHAAAGEAVRSFNRWSIMPLPDPPTFNPETFLGGALESQLRLRRGDLDGVVRLVRARLEERSSAERPDSSGSVELRVALAHALLRQRSTADALMHIQVVERWAAQAESAAVLAEGHLLRSELALLESDAGAAVEWATTGLAIAREAGLGRLHLDLLVALGRGALRRTDPDAAAHAAATALFGQEPLTAGVALYAAPARDERTKPDADDGWYARSGIFPPQETGRPELLSATHPQCRYRWGEAEAREVLAEALLAQLARYSGSAQWAPVSASAEATLVVRYAETLLEHAADLQEDLTGSPDAGERLRSRRAGLAEGELTTYPIRAAPVGAPVQPSRRRVLISYSREDSEFVDALADRLEAGIGDVWLDRRRISFGQSFVGAINNALADVTDFVVVLSTYAVTSPWVRNELESAIALRNAGQQLTIYAIQLDDVTLPPLIANLNAIRQSDRDPIKAALSVISAVAGESPIP